MHCVQLFQTLAPHSEHRHGLFNGFQISLKMHHTPAVKPTISKSPHPHTIELRSHFTCLPHVAQYRLATFKLPRAILDTPRSSLLACFQYRVKHYTPPPVILTMVDAEFPVLKTWIIWLGTRNGGTIGRRRKQTHNSPTPHRCRPSYPIEWLAENPGNRCCGELPTVGELCWHPSRNGTGYCPLLSRFGIGSVSCLSAFVLGAVLPLR